MLLSMGGFNTKRQRKQADTIPVAKVAADPTGPCVTRVLRAEEGSGGDVSLSIGEQVRVEGQALPLREPNAEGGQASCGRPALSGCSKAAPTPQQGSCFAVRSERRNDQTPQGAVLQGLTAKSVPMLLLCWQELSPGSLCCTGALWRGCHRRSLARFEQMLWP